ncbi:hypothetical protein F2Q68_00001993 [Brassica cretica]|uniref:Uncharacterized protein n=1 Tax=Brassica cretica TaxID=69181 RepID=A0A8S9JJI6_BRACR|nr:hypothetical protein F2Q68_00001993 [Brassica cretica]
MEVYGWCPPRSVVVQEGIRNLQVLEQLMAYLYGDLAITRALGDFSVRSQYAATYTMPMLRRRGDPRRCVMVLGREALRLESSNNVIVVVILLYAVITNSS